MSNDARDGDAERCCAKVGQIKTAHGPNWGPPVYLSAADNAK